MTKKPEILKAEAKLSCPLYACSFDHADPTCLVVGGGGGSDPNGVPNEVFLLDASSPLELPTAGSLTLSKSEDNVTTLVVGPRSKDGETALVFAGANGSPDDIKKGKNRHFRTLALRLSSAGGGPKAAKTSGERIVELARDALFAPRGQDLTYVPYQRLCALSHPFAGFPQLGAAADGFSKNPQIALFNVPPSTAQTGARRWTQRGTLDIPKEAMDLDVVQTGPDTYQLAYCDDHEIFTVEVSKEGVSEPKCVQTLEAEEGDKSRPTFRSLRYLSSGFLVTTVNIPASQGGGVRLHGYRLPKDNQPLARLAIRQNLPKTVSKATGLAVRNLTPPASPSEKQGDSQFVVAVAGNDRSINLLTLEHKQVHSVDLLANLAPFKHLKDVHQTGITGLSFSAFAPPKADGEAKPEISVKLASVAVGNTAVVHSIPLKEFHGPSQGGQGERPATPRYVVALKSKGESPTLILTQLTVVILLLAIIGQVVLETKGLSPELLGARNYLPAGWQLQMRRGPVVGEKSIGDLLSNVKLENDQTPVIRHIDADVLDENGEPTLEVAAHDEQLHGPATSWEELPATQQQLWKDRLKKTGHWVEATGEEVFKGVLFGELGGAIGNIINAAI
ncbi:uncharacterized protein B0I36DRAFT_70935 [Microdochium trichocladiopsis]|uniref:Guanine nucleotide-exchange factor SEC12 n=1 Tax=Microdochium trichocladiopsis TaxID=1682393 RepID=A0A9P9BY76_9PEZI|nr:uncharacterized protein B0I36DRAFT_70935 [Microdochium trichocladiopsis]KAH7037783.1 hypothetical protein B0I36DRAFT_70935 [Microdochium trichocladiopsis]